MGIINWFRDKQTPFSASFEELVCDIHSHLIPGIDDGAASINQSIEMVKELKGMGYKKAITTPHVMSDFYKNTPDDILRGLEFLRNEISKENIDFEVGAAAEYYMDEGLSEKVGKEQILTFGGKNNYLLFETGFQNPPISLRNMIFEMKTKGYTPVMAHPERYIYHWDKGIEYFEELKSFGILFQVNIASFVKANERAGKVAHLLASNDLIDFLGTDLHRVTQVPKLQKALASNSLLTKLLGSENIKNKFL